MAIANNFPNIRPSLLLDFANSKTVDPRITFARNSTATFFDDKGLLRTAAANAPRIDHDPVTGVCRGMLIEEGRTNLLTYSDQFDNAAWTKSNATVTANAITAPDGTLTADYLIENTAADTHVIYGTSTPITSGTTYTFSIYVKQGSGSRYVCLRGDSNSPNTPWIVADLSALTVSSNAAVVAASIVQTANLWRRLSLTYVASTTKNANMVVGLSNTYVVPSTSSSLGNSYTGDGTSGIYIWGAQVEAGAFPTSYIPSSVTFTGRASTGTYIGSDGLIKIAASGEARMNYNPMNLTVAPKLLLEGAATNLLTYSEQFDNAAWIGSTTASVTANATTAPDGTITADKIIPDTDTESHIKAQLYGGFTAASIYSISVHAKAAGQTTLQIYLGSAAFSALPFGNFDLTTGICTSNNGGVSLITPVGDGWYRCTLIVTASTTASAAISLGVYNTANPGRAALVAGNAVDGIYIWGAQLEEGSYPTSYIKTEASQVTRVADTSTSAQTTRAADVASMTGSNFSDWYNSVEGSFVTEMKASNIDGASGFGVATSASDGTGNNFIVLARSHAGTTNRFEGNVVTSGVGQAYFNPGDWLAGTTAKMALSYVQNSVNFSYNGISPLTDTSVSIPTVNKLFIGANQYGNGGYANGHIYRLAYYPKRLTNSQLQVLTAQ